MAATRGAAREAQTEQVVLEQMIEITDFQPGVLEGYTLDPELTKVVKRLLGYLQPVVTLMATMVPLPKRAKCRRRGVERHGLRPPAWCSW